MRTDSPQDPSLFMSDAPDHGAPGAGDSSDTPLVSCLMVTADRLELCRRSIRCYNNQTYANKELIVVDDGEQDLGPVLADIPADEVTYAKLDPADDNVLGALRNVALERANGEFVTQWDDDDWYHEERVERQAAALMEGNDACCLHGSLMHIDDPEYMYMPYIGTLENGVPGTVMHRRNEEIRYPEMRRAEDSVFIEAWRDKRYVQLPNDQSHLFIRCFHGSNTWEKKHFLTRMRNTPSDFLLYGYYRFIKRDLASHPRFQLSDTALRAFKTYIRDSVELDLFDTKVDMETVDALV